MVKALFITSEDFRGHSFGRAHPLSVPRVPLAWDLIRHYHALDDDEFLPAREAEEEELLGFHRPDYLAALRRIQEEGRVSEVIRQRYALGTLENPWFPGCFHLPALAAGGGVQAAEAALSGIPAFNPAGGMHHGRPGKAQGFCYINDVVITIQRLLAEDARVLYLDLDAHLPDGVIDAFTRDPRVALCSLHMDTRYAYPFQGGAVEAVGERGQVINVPLPKGMDDAAYLGLFRPLWERLMGRFRPDVVVLQAGTDIIRGDPLGRLSVSTWGFLQAVAEVVDAAPRLVVLGGGGYHPILLARAWLGVWGLISGRRLPEALPEGGRDLLCAVDWEDDEDEAPPGWIEALYSRRLEGPHETGFPALVSLLEQLFQTHPLLR